MNLKKSIVLKIIFIIILLSFISCNHKSNDFNKVIDIDISRTYNKKRKIYLSEVAKKIEYTQLQGDSTCYLGQIYYPNRSIHFFNDKILIKDAGDKLLLFNSTGNFLNKIGNVGKGPQEYIKPDNFTVLNNYKGGSVAVFSSSQSKVVLYNFNGKFIKNIPIDFWPTGLTAIENNLIFINNIGGRKQSNYYNLSAVSTNGKIIKRLLYKYNEKQIEKSKQLALTGFHNSYILNDTLHYWEKDYDTIWQISKNLKITPKYFINIGGEKMPFEEQTEASMFNFKKMSKYNSVNIVFESTRFILISVINKMKLHRIYYDKISKESLSIEYKKEFGKELNLSFYNDIDGGMPFWPMGLISDNKMYKLIYGYELKDYLDKKGDNVEVLDKEAREKLLQLAENSKVSDNPILMIVTLKQ